MKVLFDTNVVLDVLLDRAPFAVVVAKVAGRRKAIEAVRSLLHIFALAPVDRAVLELAASSTITDFEDAVLHEAGRLAGADAIVTRNPRHFEAGSLLVHTPADLEAMLSSP